MSLKRNSVEPMLHLMTVNLAERSAHESLWLDAEADGLPMIHEAFVRALVERGLIQGVFATPEDDRQQWLIWADSAVEAMKLISVTPLAHAGLLRARPMADPMRPARASRPLQRALRPPTRDDFHRWLMGDGMTLDEMKRAWERPGLTESESILLSFRLWVWLKAGIVSPPDEAPEDAARAIRERMLRYLRLSRDAEIAEHAGAEAQKRWRRIRGFFAERGVDIEKAFSIWRSRGWEPGDPVPEEWWREPGIELEGMDQEDEDDVDLLGAEED